MKNVFIRICIILAGIVPLGHAHTHHPLQRHRNNLRARLRRTTNEGQHLACVAETESMPNGTGRIQLCRVQNYFYLAHIRMGTPQQTLWMEFSTGFALTWVMTSWCRSKTCLTSKRYEPEQSTTFVSSQETFNFTYGAGDSVSGSYAQDTVCIGQLCLTNQSIGAAVKVEQDDMVADGLVGLACPSQSILGSPLLSNLKTKLPQSIFAVWLNRNAFKMSNGGEITLGYTNPERYIGDFAYLPIVNQSFWQIQMDAVYALTETSNQVIACPTGCKAIVATATSFILGAHNETAKIIENWDRKGLIQKDKYGDYYANCEQTKRLPTLAFILGGKRFEVAPQDYTFAKLAAYPCNRQLAIDRDIPDLDFWVLGGSFLGSHYTVFDFGQNQVGIAKSRSDTKVTGTSPKPFTHFSHDDEKCGEPAITPYTDALNTEKKIIGGNEARKNSWPWMVSLRRKGSDGVFRHVCGGTLVSNSKVISAAHCLVHSENATDYEVQLGAHILSETNTQGLVKVGKIDLPNGDNARKQQYPMDIMVITLKQPVTYNEAILPVCFDTIRTDLDNVVCYVTGWGKSVNHTSDVTSPYLKQLSTREHWARMSLNVCYLYLGAPVHKKEDCQKYIGSAFDPYFMMCAGSLAGESDTCQGDSGGPLVCIIDQKWRLYGVVNFGYRCAQPNSPTVYSKVQAYLGFIKDALALTD